MASNDETMLEEGTQMKITAPLRYLVLLVAAGPMAYGYSNPGTGLFLLQIGGAVFFGGLFYAKRIIATISGWIRPKKDNGTQSS